MKRVLFVSMLVTVLFACDNLADENPTCYEFSISNIEDLDGDIDQVIVTLSYQEINPLTGWEDIKNIVIASSSIKKKGFTVYLPEHLASKYLFDDVGSFHTDKRDLTISNPNVKITRMIGFSGYSKGVIKGIFLCDNHTETQPPAEQGYNEIGLVYSNMSSTITGTHGYSTGGNDELRHSFDLEMNAGYNLYMETTVERESDGLHHLSYSAPVDIGEGGTKWRFLRTAR